VVEHTLISGRSRFFFHILDRKSINRKSTMLKFGALAEIPSNRPIIDFFSISTYFRSKNSYQDGASVLLHILVIFQVSPISKYICLKLLATISFDTATGSIRENNQNTLRFSSLLKTSTNFMGANPTVDWGP